MVHRLLILGKEAGVSGLFAGLGPRMVSVEADQLTFFQVMTAGLVSSQFLMYGAIKNALGAKPGIEIHREE
jgi:solute carrier family 25 phosphate transporter 3